MNQLRIRTAGVTWQEIDGELVILDLERSTYLTTNKSGTFLANLLVDEHTIQDLIDALVAEYQIGDDVARRDVAKFTDSLAAKGLLE